METARVGRRRSGGRSPARARWRARWRAGAGAGAGAGAVAGGKEAAAERVLAELEQQGAEVGAGVVVDASGRCLGAGLGLRVQRDFGPGDRLLSVPLELCFAAPRGGERPWNLALAAQLLAAPASSAYKRLLPKDVPLMGGGVPTGELQFPGAVHERQVVSQILDQEMQDREAWPWPAEELLPAVAAAHSRAFSFVEQKILAPGIDFANHSFEPNCEVEIESVSGVRERPPQPNKQVFHLQAGEAGLRAGEEATISYGDWPNEVLYLYYGFLVPDNPHDSVTLWFDLQELVAYAEGWTGFAGGDPGGALAANVARVIAERCEGLGLPPGRVQATREGLDQKLVVAAEVLDVDPLVLAGARCRDLLHACATGLGDDAELLERGVDDAELELCVRFRLEQKIILAENLATIVGLLPEGTLEALPRR